jgi:hypothetical protein
MDPELKAYRDRWLAVADIERRELQSASIELRWRQLNAIVGLATSLGIMRSNDTELEIYQRWANLKEKLAGQHRPV